MAVKVRYKPLDLMEASVEVFEDAHGYEITEDHTLVLFDIADDGEWVEVGAVRAERWDGVFLAETAE